MSNSLALKQAEISQLIVKGLAISNVQESYKSFFECISGKFYLCALGAAIAGKFGATKKVYEMIEREKNVLNEGVYNPVLEPTASHLIVASKFLDIDLRLAEAIERENFDKGISAKIIAEKLNNGTFVY
jgi:hypothetical protein